MLDLDKLPHFRHEHDLSEADKQCSGCGRAKDRIGQDESRMLEYVPAKLEVHVYVRPKYACHIDKKTFSRATGCTSLAARCAIASKRRPSCYDRCTSGKRSLYLVYPWSGPTIRP